MFGRAITRVGSLLFVVVIVWSVYGCKNQEVAPAPEASAASAPPPPPPDVVVTDETMALFKALPANFDTADNPSTPEKVDLGRMLFFETRLSKNQDISCNSCHDLSMYGV